MNVHQTWDQNVYRLGKASVFLTPRHVERLDLRRKSTQENDLTHERGGRGDGVT